MADARRFPRLWGPFAIAGAAAGWLSAGFLAHPVVNALPRDKQWPAALCAMVLAAATGVLIRRWCTGAQYRYAIDPPDPDEWSASDRTSRHVLAILAAGAITGGIVGVICNVELGVPIGAIGGVACAIVFVPVALAVIGAARRAQRARLGSVVAKSDRRAVWAILSMALAVTTLEAVPNWALHGRFGASPLPAFVLAVVAGVVVAALLIADARAFRGVESALDQLEPQENLTDDLHVQTDLGLGDDVGAHVARSTCAYRDRDRMLDVVRGDAELVRLAMRAAIRRGIIGSGLAFAAALAHAIAFASAS